MKRGSLPIASGFTADIYDADPGYVLKVYHTRAISVAAAVYARSKASHRVLNKPLSSCDIAGRHVQVQRKAPGLELYTMLAQRRLEGNALSLLEKWRIFTSLAEGLHELVLLGYTIQDFHPRNVVVDIQTFEVQIVDLDSLQYVDAPCRCWSSTVCEGRIGCILQNAPEALLHCDERRCASPTLVYILAQFGSLLFLPETARDALVQVNDRGKKIDVLPKNEARTQAAARRDSLSRLLVRMLDTDPGARPTLLQAVRFARRSLMMTIPNPLHVMVLPYVPFGYHVHPDRPLTWNRMLVRWNMTFESIVRDINPDTTYYAVDWGSNEGFFSISLAYAFPKMRVLSVDANENYHGRYSQEVHRRRINALIPLRKRQNVLCQAKLSLGSIERPHTSRFDYQLAFSIFHWLPIMSLSQFNRVLRLFLLGANTTFLELPDPGHRQSANYQMWSRWYRATDSVETYIRNALDEDKDLLYTVQRLGNATIDYGRNSPVTTTREVFRVDLFPRVELGQYARNTMQEFMTHIHCDDK